MLQSKFKIFVGVMLIVISFQLSQILGEVQHLRRIADNIDGNLATVSNKMPRP